MNASKKTIRTIAAAAALAVGTGIVMTTTAAAPIPEIAPVTIAAPLFAQSVGSHDYTGTWGIEGSTLLQSFVEAGVQVSTGSTSLENDVAANAVVSHGYVGGFESLATGEQYAQLSGQAGADVTAVRVVSASGIVTAAALADGVWGAVWLAGDNAEEWGAATIEFDTPAGTSSVSTNEVDVIAASQRDSSH